MGRRKPNAAIKRNGNAGGKGTKEELQARLKAIKDGTKFEAPEVKQKKPPAKDYVKQARGGDDGIVFSKKDNPQSSAAPKEPDWICEACNASCFASRTSCYKCKNPRPADYKEQTKARLKAQKANSSTRPKSKAMVARDTKKFYDGLKAYFDKHAPGTKEETELEGIANKCVKNDDQWLTIKLNEPLKKKYGESYDEFMRSRKKGNQGGFDLFPDEESEEEAEPVIDAGYDISKWTGKTPTNLLYDLCRTKKWSKPGFKVENMGSGDNVKVGVFLQMEDSKSKEVKRAACFDKRLYVDAVQGKHFAAIYALHFINWDKPMHRLLPPGYKKYWETLEEVRKKKFDEKASKGIDQLTAPDPFRIAQAARDLEREQERRKKRREREAKQPSQDLPVVRMSDEMRAIVERACLEVEGSEENGIESGDNPLAAEITKAVTTLGFRQEHAIEALNHARDQTSVLDWLCLHVPEADLPERFRPSVKRLQTSKMDQGSLKLEYKSRRLEARGFGPKECMDALAAANYCEYRALALLVVNLCDQPEPVCLPEDITGDDLEDMREDEVESLKAILEDQYSSSNEEGHFIHQVKILTDAPKDTMLEVLVLKDSYYPFSSPTIVIRCPTLPAYACHAASKQLNVESRKLLGEPQVFELLSVAGEIIASVLKQPPPLAALKPAIKAKAQVVERKTTKKVAKTRSHIRPKIDIDPAKVVERHRCIESTEKYKDMLMRRNKLPASGFKKEVIDCVRSNQVTIISGETGCGKTTQIPQFILEDCVKSQSTATCNMICTQPRRLSAIAVSERVAAERGERLGSTIGYSIRLESKQSRDTQLLFCTTGILLRQLQSDTTLSEVSHVFIDEVHERSVDSDVALALLRDVAEKRPDIKIILMSATLDAELFSNYFGGAPAIKIPGFTYPVSELYLDDLIEKTGVRLRPSRKRRNGGKGGDSGLTQAKANKMHAQEKDPLLIALENENKKARKCDDATSSQKVDENSEHGKISDGADDWEDLAEETEGEVNETPNVQGKENGNSKLVDVPDPMKFTQKAIKKTSDVIVEEEPIEYDEYHKTSIAAIEQNPSEVNSELLCALVSHIIDHEGEGAILIFVAGTSEISRCIRALEGIQSHEHIQAMPLHASLTSEQQSAIFRNPPKGTRKIVVSTNVAETSITVDDVTHVIDTGRVKELRYDSANGMSCLVETWVSKASARQRRGRAGRTKPGKCYRLYRKSRFAGFADHQDPEILRVPLEQLCLKVAVMGRNVTKYLRSLLNSPDVSSIGDAIQVLKDLSAIDIEENVTPLGKHLADIPVDLRIGKFLIFASILGCLDAALTIASCMSNRSFFLSPSDARDDATRAQRKFVSVKSDHITLLNAYNEWNEIRRKGRSVDYDFCRDNFLSRTTLIAIADLKKQFYTSLADRGFITRDSRNQLEKNGDNENIIKAALTAGLYPRVVRIANPQTKYHQMAEGAVASDFAAKEIKFFPKEQGRVFLHPASVNFHENKFESPFIVYHEKIMTSKVFLRDATMVSAFPILFFGGELSVNHEKGWIVIDGWLRLKAPARVAVLINQLRKAVDKTLETKIENPSANIHNDSSIEALIQMLKTNGGE